MIANWLISLGEWLNKRFPERVVLNLKDYQESQVKLDQRIAKIEAEISKFNVSLGFAGMRGGMPLER